MKILGLVRSKEKSGNLTDGGAWPLLTEPLIIVCWVPPIIPIVYGFSPNSKNKQKCYFKEK